MYIETLTMNMLSLIIPFYNIEKYLTQCLDTIINQTYKNIQIILVDDGSTDLSGRICDEYADKDPRIIVIHKENGGLVSARKAGLRRATGEYVVYVDGDDWIELNAVEHMVDTIERTKADIVLFDHYENTGESQIIVRNIAKEGLYDKGKLLRYIYPHMISGEHFFEWQIFPAVWDMIISRNLLEKCQYDVDNTITMGEDASCKYPCLLLANTVYIERKAFYHYRQTQNSMIKQIPDTITERKRMKALNDSTIKKLSSLTNIFDVRNQWLSYMLFIMIPRADQLYSGFETLPFLYPYTGIRKGMKIAIYGAGTYGRRLHSYVSRTGFCEVVAWYDRNYSDLINQGLNVNNPDEISSLSCDAIIIANMFENSRQQIRSYIESRTNIRVFEIDKEFIFSDESLRGFGLI